MPRRAAIRGPQRNCRRRVGTGRRLLPQRAKRSRRAAIRAGPLDDLQRGFGGAGKQAFEREIGLHRAAVRSGNELRLARRLECLPENREPSPDYGAGPPGAAHGRRRKREAGQCGGRDRAGRSGDGQGDRRGTGDAGDHGENQPGTGEAMQPG